MLGKCHNNSHHSGIYGQHDAVHVKLQHWHKHSKHENEDDPYNNTYTRKTAGPQPRHKPADKKKPEIINVKHLKLLSKTIASFHNLLDRLVI